MPSSSLTVLVALFGMTTFWNAGRALAHERQSLFPKEEVARVELDVALGNVWIRSTEEETALVKLAGDLDTQLCETQISLIQNSLQIVHRPRAAAKDQSDACKVDLIVEVSANTSVRSVIGRGDLAVRDMEGYLGYEIKAGDVRIRDSAPLYIEGSTGIGDVFIRADTLGGGNLEIGTGAAEVRLAHAPLQGRLEVRVASGEAVVYLPRDIRLKEYSESQLREEGGDFPLTSYAGFEIGGSVMKGHMTIKKF